MIILFIHHTPIRQTLCPLFERQLFLKVEKLLINTVTVFINFVC